MILEYQVDPGPAQQARSHHHGDHHTPIRRQLIGAALRRYREAFGATLFDAAAILRCDKSRITRVEAGQRGIRPAELRRLLAEYGADEASQDTLVAMASPHGTVGWWSSHDALSDADREYLSLEALSVQALYYSPWASRNCCRPRRTRRPAMMLTRAWPPWARPARPWRRYSPARTPS